jgi:hypothetical protein
LEGPTRLREKHGEREVEEHSPRLVAVISHELEVAVGLDRRVCVVRILQKRTKHGSGSAVDSVGRKTESDLVAKLKGHIWPSTEHVDRVRHVHSQAFSRPTGHGGDGGIDLSREWPNILVVNDSTIEVDRQDDILDWTGSFEDDVPAGKRITSTSPKLGAAVVWISSAVASMRGKEDD